MGAVRELALRMHDRIAVPDRGARTLPTRVIVTGGHAAAAWAHAAWREPAGRSLPAIADALDPALVLEGLGLLAGHLGAHPSAGPSARSSAGAA